jgi:hypothetical protein
MSDEDKIRQLQRLLLGVTKSISVFLLEDVATVMESIHDMDGVKKYLGVVKTIAKVNQVGRDFRFVRPTLARAVYDRNSSLFVVSFV